MTKTSLPVKRPDGTVIIEPLRPRGATFEHVAGLPLKAQRRTVVDHGQVQRAKIFRDIAILILLAVTIFAGSAILVATIWRDVVIAEQQANIAIAEQQAIAKLVEVEVLRRAEPWSNKDMLIVLVSLAIVIIVLALARTNIVIRR